jgi:glycosyltransferase involved in cell wall biosynthesis
MTEAHNPEYTVLRESRNDSVAASVVIPVHNAERYVAATVHSALASDLKDLEVIAVDDGSSDRSLATLQAIDDPRLTVLSLSPSGGPSRPRNMGIRRARGRYVALLDADDVLKPGKISAAVTALDNHPQAGLAFGDYERMDGEGRLLDRSVLTGYPVFLALDGTDVGAGWRLIEKSQFARGLLYENFIGTSGVVLRKAVLERTGLFDESLTYSEDRDLWFRLAHVTDALYCSAVGHSYRVFPGSLTFRPGTRQASSRIAVLQRERTRWESPKETRQIDRLIAENLSGMAYELRKSGKRSASALTFLRAFGTSPEMRFLRSAVSSLLSPGRIPT